MGWSIWPSSGKGAGLYENVRKLAVNAWSCVNAPSQIAGIAAIDGPQDEVEKMMKAFDNRRKLVVEKMNAIPNISCATPYRMHTSLLKVTGWVFPCEPTSDFIG